MRYVQESNLDVVIDSWSVWELESYEHLYANYDYSYLLSQLHH